MATDDQPAARPDATLPGPDDAAVGASVPGPDDVVDPELKQGRGAATVALGTSMAIDTGESSVTGVVFPLLSAAFGVNKEALGILSAIPKVARGVLGPVWSMLADRYGKKPVLFVVTGLWGLWTVASGFATSYDTFFWLYAIAAIGTVASEPILNGLMSDLYARSERGRAFGRVRAVSQVLGIALTPLIGLFGKESFGLDGWRYAMFTIGGLSILSGLLILVFVKDPDRVARARAAAGIEMPNARPGSGTFRLSDVVGLFRIPTIRYLALMLPLVTSVVLLNFTNTFWVEVNGFSVPTAGLLLGVFFLGAALGSVVSGSVSDRVVARFGHHGRIAMMQIYLVAFALVTWLAFGFNWGTGVAYWVMIFVTGFVFPVGFSACVLPMVSSVVPAQLSATSFGVLFSLVQGIASAIISVLFGYASESTFFGAEDAARFQLVMVVFVSGAYLLNALYWFVFYRVYPRDVELQDERTAQVAAGTF